MKKKKNKQENYLPIDADTMLSMIAGKKKAIGKNKPIQKDGESILKNLDTKEEDVANTRTGDSNWSLQQIYKHMTPDQEESDEDSIEVAPEEEVEEEPEQTEEEDDEQEG